MRVHKYTTPLLYPLTGLIGGIYLQWSFNFASHLLVLGLVPLSCALGLQLVNDKPDKAKKTIALLCLLGGALLLTIQKNQRNHAVNLVADKQVDLIGIIIDKDEWGQPVMGDLYKISVDNVVMPHKSAPEPVACIVLVYCKSKGNLTVGDRIVLKGATIKGNPPPSINGNPTYDDFLIKENIVGSLFLPSARQLWLISRPLVSFSRWLWTIRHGIYKAVAKKLSPSSAQYIGLIFFGHKPDSTGELRHEFNYWGLSHYLARSGLHIVLFILIWTFLFKLFPLHIAIKRILLLTICAIYDLVSWTSIPFARAFYAFIVMKGGELWHQQTNYLHILSLICLMILLFNPMQLFFLDFQLTFALTFTLVLFSNITT